MNCGLNICNAFPDTSKCPGGLGPENLIPYDDHNPLRSQLPPEPPRRWERKRETHFQCFSQCLNLGKRRGFFSGSLRGPGTGSSPFLSYLNGRPPPPAASGLEASQQGSALPSVLSRLLSPPPPPWAPYLLVLLGLIPFSSGSPPSISISHS